MKRWKKELLFRFEDIPGLIEKLKDFAEGKKDIPYCWRGHVENNKAKNILENSQELDKIAASWVKGAHVDWQQLYDSIKPKRISLPTYLFAKETLLGPRGKETNASSFYLTSLGPSKYV